MSPLQMMGCPVSLAVKSRCRQRNLVFPPIPANNVDKIRTQYVTVRCTKCTLGVHAAGGAQMIGVDVSCILLFHLQSRLSYYILCE